jgi:beta-phosphoglucomutase-like phosphatase (HAD superfamily)
VSITENPALTPDANETWMHRLVAHYRAVRSRNPHEQLAVVFDIDGTIIDTRHLIHRTLLAYDRAQGTSHFREVSIAEIDVHETEIEQLLERYQLPDDVRRSVLAFAMDHLWSHESLLAAHHPYRGVMEVIRWFQLQPRTVVALNTGRPESIRRPTLYALNALGREYRVDFADDLLMMNGEDWGELVVDAKVAAIEALRARGLHVVAVVDNEPENLEAMAKADPSDDVLYLHASTIFLTARRSLDRSVTGEHYDLHAFVSETELQGHVQLVWGDIVDPAGLDAFLARSVHWVSVPVRLDPYGRPEIAHPNAPAHHAPTLPLGDLLEAVADAGRAVRLELAGGSALVDQVLRQVSASSVARDSLWFSGEFHELGERNIRLLRSAMPQATISCPADFLSPLVFGALEHALELLDVVREWGVDRLGLSWWAPRVRELVGELERWGREVDVCGIDDAESLLQAALLLPASVTADAQAFLAARP